MNPLLLSTISMIEIFRVTAQPMCLAWQRSCVKPWWKSEMKLRPAAAAWNGILVGYGIQCIVRVKLPLWRLHARQRTQATDTDQISAWDDGIKLSYFTPRRFMRTSLLYDLHPKLWWFVRRQSVRNYNLINQAECKGTRYVSCCLHLIDWFDEKCHIFSLSWINKWEFFLTTRHLGLYNL